jgi:hypothetical protein
LKQSFADVADGMPPPDAPVDAFARHAVKLLLQALIDDGSDGGRMRVAKALTDAAMFPKPEPRPPRPKPHLVSDNG